MVARQGAGRRIVRRMATPARRARSEEDKRERSAHLLATARAALADGLPLQALGLNELARRAGMAKANVYRYYESREAVLLALLWSEWALVDDALRVDLRALNGQASPRALAALLADQLAGAPLLCALIAALPSVLEQNLTEDTIRGLKRNILASFRSAGAAMHAACPEIPAERHAQLLNDACAVVAGLHPFAHPAPAAAAAMCAPDLAPLRHDFAAELHRFLRALAVQAADEPAPAPVATDEPPG